ncbi:uncharacterized protein LOC114185859 [Vigna unguiculata]|uniref:uncharacterized protein LOC114185859 n=1 Tax=Vigna unguiculata TaxID=3917 RepID=UPI001016124B|nr:uncharacterized protein LOC114185859 [Vigna unguiculata]
MSNTSSPLLLTPFIKLPVHLAMGRVSLCSRPPERVCVQEVLEREIRLSYQNKVKQQSDKCRFHIDSIQTWLLVEELNIFFFLPRTHLKRNFSTPSLCTVVVCLLTGKEWF